MSVRQPRVLWIEDSARLELRNLTGPIYICGRYDFHLAEDVTTAVEMLMDMEFDAVIVDVRLPPGSNPVWQSLYRKSGQNKMISKLGLQLLRWLVTSDPAIFGEPTPGWIRTERIGVFTVERDDDLRRELTALRISHFKPKVASQPDTVLLTLIEEMLDGSSKAHD